MSQILSCDDIRIVQDELAHLDRFVLLFLAGKEVKSRIDAGQFICRIILAAVGIVRRADGLGNGLVVFLLGFIVLGVYTKRRAVLASQAPSDFCLCKSLIVLFLGFVIFRIYVVLRAIFAEVTPSNLGFLQRFIVLIFSFIVCGVNVELSTVFTRLTPSIFGVF